MIQTTRRTLCAAPIGLMLILLCLVLSCLAVVTENKPPICEFGNMDIFLIAEPGSFSMLGWLVISIARFMPCTRRINILVDRGTPMRKMKLWLAPFYGPYNHMVRVYPFEHPESVPSITKSKGGRIGYILQAWVMMWADKYSLDEPIDGLSMPGRGEESYLLPQDAKKEYHSGEAEYVMFLDTDAILGLPVTCSSLFNAEGKAWLPAWSIFFQKQFRDPCVQLTGLPCDRSFMAFFPMVFPVSSFEGIRKVVTEHVAQDPGLSSSVIARNVSSFDSMFDYWASHSNWLGFSQFVVMGEAMRQTQPDEVANIYCNIGKQIGMISPLTQEVNKTSSNLLSSLLASKNVKEYYPKESMAYRSVAEKWSDDQLGKYYVPPGLHYGWVYHHYIKCQPLPQHGIVYFRASAQSPMWEKRFQSKFNFRSIYHLSEMVHRGHCVQEYTRRQSLCKREKDRSCDDPHMFVDRESGCSLSLCTTVSEMLDLYISIRAYDVEMFHATYRREIPEARNGKASGGGVLSLPQCSRAKTRRQSLVGTM